jgi:hypothetical protein
MELLNTLIEHLNRFGAKPIYSMFIVLGVIIYHLPNWLEKLASAISAWIDLKRKIREDRGTPSRIKKKNNKKELRKKGKK